ERLRGLALRHGLCDGEVEGRGNTPRIRCISRSCDDQPRNSLRIVGEPHLRASAIGSCVVKGEGEATESLRKRLCTNGIIACREFLKQRYGFPNRQSVDLDLRCPAHPIGEA